MRAVPRVLLDTLANLVGLALVIFGSVTPGREIAIGGGMGLIATVVGAKAISRAKDDDS